MNIKKVAMSKNRTVWISALVAIMALTGFAMATNAKSNTYTISESGSFFSGIQQTGVYGPATSDLAITSGKGGGLGQTSTQARFVWDLLSITPNLDPDSGTYPYVMHVFCVGSANPADTSNFVLRAESRGDLLFGEANCSLSTNKFNGDTGAFKLHIVGTITGGTGKFEGATGTFVTVSIGATLPGPGGYFGWVVSKGKIIIDE